MAPSRQRRRQASGLLLLALPLVSGACTTPSSAARSGASSDMESAAPLTYGSRRAATAEPTASQSSAVVTQGSENTGGHSDDDAQGSRSVLRLTDPQTLRGLEQAGFSAREMFSKVDRATGAPPGSSYRHVREALVRDVEEVRKGDPHAGVGVARYTHRLFDVRWLDDPDARFHLIGVVPRLDRSAFRKDGCGEVRLIYRLGYDKRSDGEPLASRLPATVSFEHFVARDPGDPSCRRAAKRWLAPADGPEPRWSGPDGPLDTGRLLFGEGQLRVVLNVQTVRWPSTVRPNLGGHAEYSLRAFEPARNHGLRPAPLENTPDVARLRADPALKRRFVEWLTLPETLATIDRGTVLVPEEFLATKAISVTPRGLARRANRPFRSVLAPADLAPSDLAPSDSETSAAWVKRNVVRSPAAALRRLDQLSCPGCHQARSVAGFHFLGEDPEDTPAPNRVALALSAHAREDDARRHAVVTAALNDEPVPDQQPFAERADLDAGGYGAHCSLGSDPSYADWGCNAGLVCTPYDEPAAEGIGICLPRARGRAGDPCEVSTLTPHLDPRRDGATARKLLDCHQHAACNRNAVGFPGGMCTETCAEADPAGTTRCGAIAVLDPFNACLARQEPFSHCLATHVRPAGLRACNADMPCRDDYLCAGQDGSGVCVPPYFLFQMRVDGHP